MQHILVLGAGRVAAPLVQYLLDQPEIELTAFSLTDTRATDIVEAHPRGSFVSLDIDDAVDLSRHISKADLVISLMPYDYHVSIAKQCIEHKRHMITTSYISPEMRKLDESARQAGVLILGELGLDPGIDHLSAMRIIDRIKAEGGTVTSLRSYCGGLPAPEANTNPFGYKFSWSPRGVLLAGKNPAKYLEDEKEIHIGKGDLFDNYWPVEVPGVGTFEGYPNRDSMIYTYLYGLDGISTMLRGTLRYPGWSKTMKILSDLGLFSLKEPEGFAGGTWAELIAHLTNAQDGTDLRQAVTEKAGPGTGPEILDKMEWLGLFSDQKLPEDEVAVLDKLCELMEEKMRYKPQERDMIVMYHECIARFGSGEKRITSVLDAYGIPGDDSAMARTVGLPAAIGAARLLEGKIRYFGVHTPVHPQVYNPILDELEHQGISFKETEVELGEG